MTKFSTLFIYVLLAWGSASAQSGYSVLKFGLFADTQYASCPAENTRFYRQLGMPAQYYSFKKQNWVFILLNTNEVSAYAHVEGTPKEQELEQMLEQIEQTGGSQAYRWNGGISKKQMKWLNRLLHCRENPRLHLAERTGKSYLSII